MTLALLLLGTAAAVPLSAPFSDAHRGYFYPTAYYDHSGVDWACGSIRYSGHRGSDFGAGSWSGMSAGRDIVAAADGTVVVAHDGEYDQCSTGNCSGGGGFGNYVAVRHSDGSTTYYAHMKKWTVAVSYGQRVSCGDKLGQVGSSGYSTGPHLHFEPRSSGNVSIEPFSGSCSGWSSSWISQGSHGGLPGKSCGPADNDGDGYDADRDCDDGNRNIHPGATEVCDNGVDEDCNGSDLASVVWFEDGDGDGYGDRSVRGCGSQPAGTSARDGDCDDERASVNPGVHELCDGLDNDCNGEIDDGPPTEMGAERPALAAQIVDLSAPGLLEPGESGPVWVVVENVGAQDWHRGELWLQPDNRDTVSLLHDESVWPAWDVLAVLETDVPVGATGVLSGTVRLSEHAGARVQETFALVAAGGPPVRCPSGELTVDLYARAATASTGLPGLPTAADELGSPSEAPPRERGRGCATADLAPPWAWLLALWGTLLVGRRRC